MADDLDAALPLDGVAARTRELTASANGFARAMTAAFAASVTGARQFDQVLQTLTLRLSAMAVRLAMRPLERALGGGIEQLLSGVVAAVGAPNSATASGDVRPFAAGGVLGAPAYFPLAGGFGLAGEAGPEAILPLSRGADGRLGVAASGGATHVTVQIATPDADSFRRSEAYVAGQIARAVARGRRAM